MKEEFDAFLECGILANGFLRLRCGDCGHDELAAFSCKRRVFCPSCGARRMALTAAHLVDCIIPHVPVRQWVLSLPIPLRLLQADACTYRIAFGPRAGHKVLTLQGAMPRQTDFKQNLCADISGFSLHAGVRCGAEDRQALGWHPTPRCAHRWANLPKV